jgi:3-polyprenyl-4-hydroxybenzoate decarboxylase
LFELESITALGMVDTSTVHTGFLQCLHLWLGVMVKILVVIILCIREVVTSLKGLETKLQIDQMMAKIMLPKFTGWHHVSSSSKEIMILAIAFKKVAVSL